MNSLMLIILGVLCGVGVGGGIAFAILVFMGFLTR